VAWSYAGPFFFGSLTPAVFLTTTIRHRSPRVQTRMRSTGESQPRVARAKIITHLPAIRSGSSCHLDYGASDRALNAGGTAGSANVHPARSASAFLPNYKASKRRSARKVSRNPKPPTRNGKRSGKLSRATSRSTDAEVGQLTVCCRGRRTSRKRRLWAIRGDLDTSNTIPAAVASNRSEEGSGTLPP
jgi:hypothetical protein